MAMNIPRKYRGIIMLGTLFIITPVVLWYFSIRNTASLALESRRLEKRIKEMSDRVDNHHDLIHLDKGIIMNGELLTMTLQFASKNGVSVGNYVPSVTYHQGLLEIHTTSLTLSGPFNSILRTIYSIETFINSCKATSLHFEVVSPSNGLGYERLDATLYMEQLIKTDIL